MSNAVGPSAAREQKRLLVGLRRKFAEAKERGMSSIEAIHNFRVVLSCVKRYAKTGVKGDDCAREDTRPAKSSKLRG